MSERLIGSTRALHLSPPVLLERKGRESLLQRWGIYPDRPSCAELKYCGSSCEAPGFSRTGTPACPRVLHRNRTGRTRVSYQANLSPTTDWRRKLIGYTRSRYNQAVAFLARCRWSARTLLDGGGRSDVQGVPSKGMAKFNFSFETNCLSNFVRTRLLDRFLEFEDGHARPSQCRGVQVDSPENVSLQL